MPVYELRRSDGVNCNYMLPSDRAATRYAAAVTERGVRVEIWAGNDKVSSVTGSKEELLPGAWLFDRSDAQTGTAH
jgi:hypothetical protein